MLDVPELCEQPNEPKDHDTSQLSIQKISLILVMV